MCLETLHRLWVVGVLDSVVEPAEGKGENVNDRTRRAEDDDEAKEVWKS